MAKIVEINKDRLTILLDDNTRKIFPLADASCTLKVGQEVDVFSNGEVTIIKDSTGSNDSYEDSNIRDDYQNTRNAYNNDFGAYTYTFDLDKYKIKKSKYILLCILGFTGIQRMLTNRMVSGMVCLISLFSGILSFIPIVLWAYDMVVALFTPTDKDGYIYV